MHIIDISGAVARVRRHETLTKGRVGAQVQFLFDEDWEGLGKLAVFRAGEVKKDGVIDAYDMAVIPWEVLENVGIPVEIGVYGVNEAGGIVMPTVWAETKEIQEGADPSGDESLDPTLEVWAQILGLIGDLGALDTEERDTLVNAINEALADNGVFVEDIYLYKNGDTGDESGGFGVGIASVTQTTASSADGGLNIWTVKLTDGTTSTFTVRNGSKGSIGATGATGAAGEDGGYYAPSVDRSGNLSWTPTKTTMPVPTTVNIKGPQGDPGTGVTILGSYETAEELKAAHPTGSAGDSYLVDGNLYVWSETESDWKNVGNIQGPKGEDAIFINTAYIGADGHLYIGFEDGHIIDCGYAKGDTGATGETGATGPAGEDGGYYKPVLDSDGDLYWESSKNSAAMPNIISGNIKGPQGETGATGPQGEKGDTGARGIYYEPAVDSSGNLSWTPSQSIVDGLPVPVPSTVNIKGPQGETGAPGGGAASYVEPSTPNTLVGSVGDFWYDTANSHFYICTAVTNNGFYNIATWTKLV